MDKIDDRIEDILTESEEHTLEPGVESAQLLLCKLLKVDTDDVRWDAASETYDGDTMAQFNSILEVAFGEDYEPISEKAKESA